MVEHMKGAVIVDVSIDTGGCFETQKWSHEKPTFIKSNVVHYCSFLRVKTASLGHQ
jgi:alanine dehydrogenase